MQSIARWQNPLPGYIWGRFCRFHAHSVHLGALSPWALSPPGNSVSLGALSSWALSPPGRSVLLGARSPWALGPLVRSVLLGARCPWALSPWAIGSWALSRNIPKNSPLGPQKVKNDQQIKSKSKVRIEGTIEYKSKKQTANLGHISILPQK